MPDALDAAPPSAAHAVPARLLYSQTQHDERGNFTYSGDLQRPGADLTALTILIQQHLAGVFSGTGFSVKGERFAGGRKVIVEVLDCPTDLSSGDLRETFTVAVRDQIERFGFTRSNILQDYMNVSFFNEVRIGGAYWAALSARKGTANPVKATMSLAAFKRAVKVGDRLRLAAAPGWNGKVGTTRSIVQVRSSDIVLEGPSYLRLPKAAAFACDGEKIRIGIGYDREPDAHLLYDWIRSAA